MELAIIPHQASHLAGLIIPDLIPPDPLEVPTLLIIKLPATLPLARKLHHIITARHQPVTPRLRHPEPPMEPGQRRFLQVFVLPASIGCLIIMAGACQMGQLTHRLHLVHLIPARQVISGTDQAVPHQAELITRPRLAVVEVDIIGMEQIA